MVAVGVTTSLFAVGCGGGSDATRESQPRADEPPSVASDPSAERRRIRLTGCVKPDATPGRFVLASVATAGIGDGDEGDGEKPRSWAAEGKETPESQAATIATSTYQLLPGDGDEAESFAQYRNKRVTVHGRLAAETPTGTAGTAQAPGAAGQAQTGQAQTDAAGAKVTAPAPPLRGVYVEKISKVSDSCTD
jgi:hypothetical protein